MNETCEFSRDFSTWVNTPEGGPFWSHTQTCPDCQALLHAYDEFNDPGEDGDLPFDLDRADHELATRLGLELGFPLQQAPLKRDPQGSAPSWIGKKFWYSTAAVLLVGSGFFLNQDLSTVSVPDFDGDSGLVRGEKSTVDQFSCTRDNGTLQIIWPEDKDADLIRIILFDGSMKELGRFNAPVDAPFLMPESPLTKKAIYGQIFYIALNDVIQRGSLFSIPPAP